MKKYMLKPNRTGLASALKYFKSEVNKLSGTDKQLLSQLHGIVDAGMDKYALDDNPQTEDDYKQFGIYSMFWHFSNVLRDYKGNEKISKVIKDEIARLEIKFKDEQIEKI